MPDSGLTDNVSYYTSSFHDTYVRQQVITTCTSATRPTTVEGRVIYETDTDLLLCYSGTAWVPSAGPSTGWTSFTPQIDQGASTNIAKTTTYSKWCYTGFKTVTWAFSVAMTAGGTSGSRVTITLPVTAASANGLLGAGFILDASAAFYNGSWRGSSTTALRFESDDTNFNGWGATPSIALAASDVLSGLITYEIA